MFHIAQSQSSAHLLQQSYNVISRWQSATVAGFRSSPLQLQRRARIFNFYNGELRNLRVHSESAAHLKTGRYKHHSPPLPSCSLHLFERNRPSWQRRTAAAANRAARQWTVANASRVTFSRWLSGSQPRNQRSYCKTTAPLCHKPNFRRPCRRSRRRRPPSKYRRGAQSASDRFRPHGQGHLLSRQAPGRTLIAQIRSLSALVIFEH
jgi:hypothetical protein